MRDRIAWWSKIWPCGPCQFLFKDETRERQRLLMLKLGPGETGAVNVPWLYGLYGVSWTKLSLKIIPKFTYRSRSIPNLPIQTIYCQFLTISAGFDRQLLSYVSALLQINLSLCVSYASQNKAVSDVHVYIRLPCKIAVGLQHFGFDKHCLPTQNKHLFGNKAKRYA